MESRKTSVYEYHVKHGGKIVDFAGWKLPVEFSGLIKEHMAVRKEAGIFDVSHMGEFIVEGIEAKKLVQYIITNDVNNLYPGKALYSAMCYEDGGIVDDLLVYMYSDQKYLLVVNALNIEKDFNWIKSNNKFKINLTNVSDEYFQLAVQGPKARGMFAEYLKTDLSDIKFFHFKEMKVDGVECLVSRTGYTGEDGFEIYGPWASGGELFDKLVKFGFTPCGLGCRDTLRLEAGLMLYGNDIDNTTTPLEAGINFCVRLNKDADFIGKSVLVNQKEYGLRKKLYGITILDKGIARHGYEIVDANDNKHGYVTSGTMSPSLSTPVALAYINTGSDPEKLFVKIRKNLLKIKVIGSPFVKKGTNL